MEKLNSLYEQVTERLKSPLIFSFIFSWILTNWKIPVAMFFTDELFLVKSGYKNLLDYIEQQITFQSGFCVPVGGALLYTFGYPWVKHKVMMYHVKWDTKSYEERIVLTKEANVPLEKFMTKVNYLKDLQNDMVESIRNENNTIDELNRLLSREKNGYNDLSEKFDRKSKELEAEQNRVQAASLEIQRHETATNNERFYGKWRITYGEIVPIEWHISMQGIDELALQNNFPQRIGNVEFSYWQEKRTNNIILIIRFDDESKSRLGRFTDNRLTLKFDSNTEGIHLTSKFSPKGIFTMDRLD